MTDTKTKATRTKKADISADKPVKTSKPAAKKTQSAAKPASKAVTPKAATPKAATPKVATASNATKAGKAAKPSTKAAPAAKASVKVKEPAKEPAKKPAAKAAPKAVNKASAKPAKTTAAKPAAKPDKATKATVKPVKAAKSVAPAAKPAARSSAKTTAAKAKTAKAPTAKPTTVAKVTTKAAKAAKPTVAAAKPVKKPVKKPASKVAKAPKTSAAKASATKANAIPETPPEVKPAEKVRVEGASVNFSSVQEPPSHLTMRAETNRVVAFHYRLCEVRPDGNRSQWLEASFGRQPLLYLHGHGNVVPGLEQAMAGKRAGDRIEITLTPEQAYGQRTSNELLRVPIKHLQRAPERKHLVPGVIVSVKTNRGVKNALVIKVGKFNVDLDTNHPYAGRTLHYQIEVLGVRQASAEEVAHRHVHGQGGHQH